MKDFSRLFVIKNGKIVLQTFAGILNKKEG